jgi:hypothetical protein
MVRAGHDWLQLHMSVLPRFPESCSIDGLTSYSSTCLSQIMLHFRKLDGMDAP